MNTVDEADTPYLFAGTTVKVIKEGGENSALSDGYTVWGTTCFDSYIGEMLVLLRHRRNDVDRLGQFNTSIVTSAVCASNTNQLRITTASGSTYFIEVLSVVDFPTSNISVRE